MAFACGNCSTAELATAANWATEIAVEAHVLVSEYVEEKDGGMFQR